MDNDDLAVRIGDYGRSVISIADNDGVRTVRVNDNIAVNS